MYHYLSMCKNVFSTVENKEKYTLKLALVAGDNILEMIAINTGKFYPNTAAFQFKNNNKEQVVELLTKYKLV